jgi:hypothetical protein
MTILASIGMWLLKAILGGILGKIDDTITEEANRQKDAALLKAKTVEEGTAIEVQMIEKEKVIDKQFVADKAARPADDPFGVGKWNAGEKP